MERTYLQQNKVSCTAPYRECFSNWLNGKLVKRHLNWTWFDCHRAYSWLLCAISFRKMADPIPSVRIVKHTSLPPRPPPRHSPYELQCTSKLSRWNYQYPRYLLHDMAPYPLTGTDHHRSFHSWWVWFLFVMKIMSLMMMCEYRKGNGVNWNGIAAAVLGKLWRSRKGEREKDRETCQIIRYCWQMTDFSQSVNPILANFLFLFQICDVPKLIRSIM